jgi:hypothetical protein
METDRAGSMTSTDDGRKTVFNRAQAENASEARYQHWDGNSKVNERRH